MGHRNQDSTTSGYREVADEGTTAAALEDISGCSVDLVVKGQARILATLTVQCSATSAGVGAWAIEVNGVDGSEVQRYLSASNDTGVIAVQTRSAVLPPGTYTVQGRHRRVSGAGTVTTDFGQLSAIVVEPN